MVVRDASAVAEKQSFEPIGPMHDIPKVHIAHVELASLKKTQLGTTFDYTSETGSIRIGTERHIQSVKIRTALCEYAKGRICYRLQSGEIEIHKARIPEDDEMNMLALKLAAFEINRKEVSASIRDSFYTPVFRQLRASSAAAVSIAPFNVTSTILTEGSTS